MTLSISGDDHAQPAYALALTPLTRTASIVHEPTEDPYKTLRVNRLVYTSAILAYLQVIQFGWGLSQVNLGKFNNQADCDARPVVEGTCLMFPGHSKTEWLFVVNSWVVGGMIGGLSSGFFSDRFGRKRTLVTNGAIMIVGAIIQAAAPSLPVFSVGRFIAGLAAGGGIAMSNGYVNEVSPPHLRALLGSGYGVGVASGVLLVSIAFFFADTSTGWRYMGGFPIIIGAVVLIFGPNHMVESPAWLLLHDKHEEAERVLARLYGEENVDRALTWITTKPAPQRSTSLLQATEEALQEPVHSTEKGTVKYVSPIKALFSKQYLRHTVLAMHIAMQVQLTGINAVFFYSSTLFRTAGVTDGRIASLVVSLCYISPVLFIAFFTRRFGNRNVILSGLTLMLIAAVGLTLALSFHVSALAIFFIGLYSASFSGSVGAISYPTGVGVFPDALRATGTSVMMLVNWCGTLTIGLGYPYVSTALDELAFLPFVGFILYFMIFMSFLLPNTTGKTNEEIQDMFRRKVIR
ncbi:hypothetical protein Poli38472_001164 [Pythium oligandrum]|uniref:Hexose transporter 1 n=1 Tax=Pythium oligandrum TaxID=41045 RepID=A0A8K1CVH3_PYTOL|nr:hypothetical protein Poli38472_001164 [Pythium oligandrum]|eukprot:TMW69008.1 hypothetical protein Poli38472_001164 [Pythium oligandrum]